MNKKILWVFAVVLIIVGGLVAVRFGGENQVAEQSDSEEATGLANPASVYCAEQGGDLEIEIRPGVGDFGVCYFMDNHQCEEWAMLRGDCPVGGLKVTGYITPAGRFCAISGGDYKITVEGNVETEKGNCTLPSGEVCGADEFWEGSCPVVE